MDDAREFLKELYGELKEGEFIEIRSIGRKPNRMFMKSADAAVTAAAGLAQNSDVFYGVATRDGRGGKKENIVRIPAVWVDLDNKEGYPLLSERLLRIEDFPTSAVIASGSGLHLYWFLDHFVGPDQIPLIEKINKTMATRIGGDTAYDAARCLRIPGTLNHKYQPEPREVKVSSFHPEYRFTTEHLCCYLGIGAGSQGPGASGEVTSDQSPVTSKGHDRLGHAVQVAGSPDILSCASPSDQDNMSKEQGSRTACPGPSSGPSGSVPLPCRNIIWRGVAEGGRNNACFQLALDLKKQAVPAPLAVELLNRWNVSNLPPMEPSRITATVEAVYKGNYTGLGCDKSPMKDFCSGDCVVRARGRLIDGGGRESRVESRELDGDIPHSPAPAPPALKFWTWKELVSHDFPPQEFVIERLVPRNGVTMLTGEGGIGKSFILVEIASIVAGGGRFLDEFECIGGPVVVLDLENPDQSISQRARKINAARSLPLGTDDLPVRILRKMEMADSDVELAIDQPRGYEAVENAVRDIRPILLIIDPLVAIHSKDENDNVAMRSVLKKLQRLARDHHLAVLLVHHTRKRGVVNDAGQMIRGASDLRNAVDSHICLRRVSKDRIMLEQDKNRHAPELDKILIQMMDSEDGTATCFRYAGQATEAEEKAVEVRESILSLLSELGQCKRGLLVARLKTEGLSSVTIDRTLAAMVEEGVIFKPSHGCYALAEQEVLLEA